LDSFKSTKIAQIVPNSCRFQLAISAHTETVMSQRERAAHQTTDKVM